MRATARTPSMTSPAIARMPGDRPVAPAQKLLELVEQRHGSAVDPGERDVEGPADDVGLHAERMEIDVWPQQRVRLEREEADGGTATECRRVV